jgi:hypothetical protein
MMHASFQCLHSVQPYHGPYARMNDSRAVVEYFVSARFKICPIRALLLVMHFLPQGAELSFPKRPQRPLTIIIVLSFDALLELQHFVLIS